VPSPSVVGAEQESIPERPSAQVKLTMTSLSYQPFAFEARSGLPLIVGGVLSRET
jgi:hypothetical protein